MRPVKLILFQTNGTIFKEGMTVYIENNATAALYNHTPMFLMEIIMSKTKLKDILMKKENITK